MGVENDGEMIKVSFVVAIYNVGRYLPQCIESIVEQNMTNVEILLVNDGSTDDSLAICESYAARDDRIRVINQVNGGANAARNAGLQLARGEWVYFVDGDDFVAPTVCTGIEKYLDQNYDIVMFSNARFVNGQIGSIPYSKEEKILQKEDFEELQLSALNRLGRYRFNYEVLDLVSIWNKMYRNSFLKSNRLSFIPDFPKLQDLSFNLLVYQQASRAVYTPNVGYYFRHNDQSVSHRYQKDMIEKFDVINAWFEKFIADKRDNDKFVAAYRERIATHMRTCIVRYLCNRQNEKSYRERKSEFHRLRVSEPYKTALDQTRIRSFHGYKEQVLAYAVKYRQFWLCELLCMLNEKAK